MPDDVIEDRFWREQQPPVKAHRARLRAARPPRPLATDHEPLIRAAGDRTGMVEPRGDLGGCRPPVPALECRLALGGSCGYEQRVPASVHPRAAGLGDRVECLPEIGDGAAPRRDSSPCALDLTQPPLDPRPQLDDGCCRRSFRSAPRQHDLDPPRRVDCHPDATGSFGAANLVGDATGFHGATGYGAATTMTSRIGSKRPAICS